MANKKIVTVELDDGSIVDVEVDDGPQDTGYFSGIQDWATERGKDFAGNILAMGSAFSPAGDYTLDALAGLIPNVEAADLRNLANQYRQENPKTALGYEALGAFTPMGIYKRAAGLGEAAQATGKALPVIQEVLSKGGEAALKSPVITNLLESFVKGSSRPSPEADMVERILSGGVEAAGAGGMMALGSGLSRTGLPSYLGSKLGIPNTKMPSTALTPGEQQIVETLGKEEVAGMTPEKIQQAIESQRLAAEAGQGGMETVAESLGPVTQGIAGTYAQGPAGLEIATQALEGRTSPETLNQQMGMIMEPLGKSEGFLPSQREGYEALEETLQKGQQALSARGKEIYQGAFKEEVPYRVVNEYGQEEVPRQFGINQPYRQEALPPKIEFSPEITRASEDPTYQSLARNYIATTYPKGEAAPDIRSQEVANQVASQLKQALKNPRKYLEETQIKIADIPGRKLLETIEDELVARNPDLPQRRLAYKEAAPEAKGMSADVEQQVQNILSGGPLGQPGERLMSSEVDPDSFKMIVNAVEKQGGQEAVDKIKRSVAGAIERAYSQEQGQRLINAPFEKGNERFQKMVALVGEERATKMLGQVRRLTDFVKFKNKILGGSPTQPRQEMARQIRELNETTIADNVDSFLNFVSGKRGVRSWIVDTAKSVLGTKNNPITDKEIAKYLFSQGDDAVTKLKASQMFLRDLQKTKAGREKIDSLFNSYIQKELSTALSTSGLQYLKGE
jgi:hypothetical protein